MATAPEIPKINSPESAPEVVPDVVEQVEKKADVSAETKYIAAESKAEAERLGDVIHKASALGVVAAAASDPAGAVIAPPTPAQVDELYAKITGVSLEDAAKLSTAKKLELLVADSKSAVRPAILNEEVDLLVEQSHKEHGLGGIV